MKIIVKKLDEYSVNYYSLAYIREKLSGRHITVEYKPDKIEVRYFYPFIDEIFSKEPEKPEINEPIFKYTVK